MGDDAADRRLDAVKRKVKQARSRGAQRQAAHAFRQFYDERFRPFVGDPVAFAEHLVDPDTGQRFVLYEAERRFLAEALTLTPDGRLPYPELVFSAPKKSGKTTLAAIVLLYVVRVIGGEGAEGFVAANDFDQAAGRVFKQALRIVDASPLLAGSAPTTTEDVIRFADGATITALPSDYAGAAGAAPSITVFDELWAFTSERAHRLWDELVPVPTRAVSVRLTVTYAGFEGESDLLLALRTRGLAGAELAPALYRQPGMLMYWTHEPVAPWQTDAWRAQMRDQLRPNAYARMIENRFVSTEGGFVEAAWWAACEDPTLRPVVAAPGLPVWVGIDASVKHDTTAIVAVTWDAAAQRVRLVWHRIFRPTPAEPLDFGATIERTVRELGRRFRLREVRFDPFQMVSTGQRLAAARVPMVEFPQTVPNLTEASANLYELIKGGNLVVYPDADLRLAVQRAVAKETGRGWKISKELGSHHIDVVVALAQACLGAIAALPAERHYHLVIAGDGATEYDRDGRVVADAPAAEVEEEDAPSDEQQIAHPPAAAPPDPVTADEEFEQERERMARAWARQGNVWMPGEPFPDPDDEDEEPPRRRPPLRRLPGAGFPPPEEKP